jgi:hypothetical protein
VAAVYTVQHDDLAAVVSDTPIVIYDPTRENVLAHEFVNETVMKEHTVIPMSFGTGLPLEDDVTELLALRTRRFGRARQDAGQDRVRAQGALGPEKVIASLERDNDEIRRLKDEISRHTATSTYFARMQLGDDRSGAGGNGGRITSRTSTSS